MAVLLWRDTGRVIRSQVLVIKEQAFVSAARVSGASDLAYYFCLHRAQHLAAHFSLWLLRHRLGDPDRSVSVSFLGFSDPNTISWGFMLQDAFNCRWH